MNILNLGIYTNEHLLHIINNEYIEKLNLDKNIKFKFIDIVKNWEDTDTVDLEIELNNIIDNIYLNLDTTNSFNKRYKIEYLFIIKIDKIHYVCYSEDYNNYDDDDFDMEDMYSINCNIKYEFFRLILDDDISIQEKLDEYKETLLYNNNTKIEALEIIECLL